MRSKLILTSFLVVILALPLNGAICSRTKKQNTEPVTLKIWVLNEDKKNYDNLTENYKEQNPNVSFEIVEKKESSANYETELVNAIAAKNGPDIAMIKDDWYPKHTDKLVPMPTQDSSILDEFKNVFIDTVVDQVVIDNKIYGIPTKIDTLALYYNTDDLDEAKISHAPKTWEEFVFDVKKLTKRDQFGNITHSAVALGTSNNVANSQDILYNLMIQNGARMTSDDRKSATFNTSVTKASGEPYYPGTKSLEFYNSFANPSKETYTWNNAMPDSVRAFVDGKVSMIIDYSYRKSEIYNLSPTINFSIAPIPQIKDAANPATFPYFWGYSVTNNSAHSDIAWDFVRYMGRGARTVKKETAQESYNDMVKGGDNPFEGQPYIAKAWYRTKNPDRTAEIFRTMITNVVAGQPFQAAIDEASASVTQILQTSG